MQVEATSHPEVLLVRPDVFEDPRGFFMESFHARKYAAQGLPGQFVQDNHSRSTRGVLRGLQNMRTPLKVAVGLNVVNIVLDPVLIFGWGPVPSLGIAGAALATAAVAAVARGYRRCSGRCADRSCGRGLPRWSGSPPAG